MIHPACKERGHNWDNWRWYPSYLVVGKISLAVIDHDTYTPPPGATGTGDFFYKRACQNMGCDVVEYAEDLAPKGRNEVVDHGGSEELYQRGSK